MLDRWLMGISECLNRIKKLIYDIFGFVILFGSQKKWATNKEQGDCDINEKKIINYFELFELSTTKVWLNSGKILWREKGRCLTNCGEFKCSRILVNLLLMFEIYQKYL